MNKTSPDDLAEQIAQLRADMVKIAGTLAALGKAKSEALSASLTEEAETLRTQGLGSLDMKMAEVTDYARRNPVQALAMAGGLGLLIGLLFARR